MNKLLKIFVLLSLFIFSNYAAAETLSRSTEYPSPFGIYSNLSAFDATTLTTGDPTLTTGTKATSAGTPANAAQSTFTIDNSLTVNQGEVLVDENLNIDNKAWYTYSGFNGIVYYFWTVLGNDPNYNPGTGSDLGTEFQATGNIFAQAFRAAPDNNLTAAQGYYNVPEVYNDQLLYFDVPHDGSWVEMGSDFQGTNAGYNNGLSVARFYASPAIILNYNSSQPNPLVSGNVGIGTTDPSQGKLQIGTPGSGLYAVGWTFEGFSSRKYKKNISAFTLQDFQKISSEIDDLKIIHFHYKKEKQGDQLRTGVIAEEAPKELLGVDGKSLSLTDTIGFLTAGIKIIKSENNEMEREIASLERAIAALKKKKGIT